MGEKSRYAPGWPGIPPRWTSSAKTGVGTSLGMGSRIWYTISHGIFNEIYQPRVDQACTRDMGFIVTDGKEFFSEEKRHTNSRMNYLAEGVPGFRLENKCVQGRYVIEKEILSDPAREVVLQKTKFTPIRGGIEDYHLYIILAPHLGNRGSGNTAWVGDYKGMPMLFARRQNYALALACSAPFLKMSAGFAGASDGWQDISRNKRMEWEYEKAENGNVALTGEIDILGCEGEFIIALGFGSVPAEAGNLARASLLDGFEKSKSIFIREWQDWQRTLLPIDMSRTGKHNLYRVSTAVIRTHEGKKFTRGLIASLSVPWGTIKGDDELGGYHLVWPRDLVESAGGLLAAGANEDVKSIIQYLQVTQESDGHWPQNMWLDGTPSWRGIQLDETAFPILLVELARREGAITEEDIQKLWPMVKKAAAFIASNGPVTPLDRWEEDPGYSPFTLAVEISALLVAADIADLNKEFTIGAYLRETADIWNSNVEKWTYATGTELAHSIGVDGYYVRIAPPEVAESASPFDGFVPIKNRPIGQSTEAAGHIISLDALALVRFGLRSPNDPRILNTIKVFDALLKINTPFGQGWHRYNDDGYGEHLDGSPFDGTGVGRIWPLLTGERAHYELAAGRKKEAEELMATLSAFANDGGLIPEQVWDSTDIPERELFCGRPSGSATPLVWAHAEYIKLIRSLKDGRVFDTPSGVCKYFNSKSETHVMMWRPNQKIRSMPVGKVLRVELLCPSIIHWSIDNWKTVQDIGTRDSGLGVHYADLLTERIPEGETVRFTFYFISQKRWAGMDYEVNVTLPARPRTLIKQG